MKTCYRCKEAKPFSDFQKCASEKDGLQKACRPCRKAIGAARYQANKERIKVVARKWSKENPEAHKAAIKRWHKENPEFGRAKARRYRAVNPDKVKAYISEWRSKNKHKQREHDRNRYMRNPMRAVIYVAKRRADKIRATPAWASNSEISVYYMFSRYLSLETGVAWVVDHIVPLNSELVCGFHAQQNLSFMLSALNAKKSNKVWPDMPSS